MASENASAATPPATPAVLRRMTAAADDVARFKAAFDANGSPRELAHLRWQYLTPPADKLMVLFAEPGGDHSSGPLAAIYATCPVWMKARDKRVLGAQSLNTLTDSAHRGKGLFARLASTMFEEVGPAEGVACVYGFPNRNSAPGFFGRLKWSALDPVPYMIKPLRTRYVLQRLLGRGRWTRWIPDLRIARVREPKSVAHQEWRDIDTFDSAFDVLWSHFSRHIDFAVVRDAAYLNWRLKRPESRYETQALYEHGRLLGFVTTSLGSGADGRHGHVVELIHDPGRPVAGVLLTAGLRRLALQGADVAVAWNLPGSPNHGAFRRAGFLTVPQRFHPIELHFGARWLGANSPAGWDSRDHWYISYLDCDTK